MSLNNIFDIAGSGMTAQSVRLNTTASNIANASSAASNTDDVYRARKPIFAAIQHEAAREHDMQHMNVMSEHASHGVHVHQIVESEAEYDMRYEPNHPLADEKGYVIYPNVNVVEEMADMLSASRGYQTNVDVMDAAKTMMQRVLTLGQ